MGYKKREEEKSRERDPEKVKQYLNEYKNWEGWEDTIYSIFAFYYGGCHDDIVESGYKTFYDWFMYIGKTWDRPMTDEKYFELFKDKIGRRQTIMCPHLNDNNNIVVRVVPDDWNTKHRWAHTFGQYMMRKDEKEKRDRELFNASQQRLNRQF